MFQVKGSPCCRGFLFSYEQGLPLRQPAAQRCLCPRRRYAPHFSLSEVFIHRVSIAGNRQGTVRYRVINAVVIEPLCAIGNGDLLSVPGNIHDVNEFPQPYYLLQCLALRQQLFVIRHLEFCAGSIACRFRFYRFAELFHRSRRQRFAVSVFRRKRRACRQIFLHDLFRNRGRRFPAQQCRRPVCSLLLRCIYNGQCTYGQPCCHCQ